MSDEWLHELENRPLSEIRTQPMPTYRVPVQADLEALRLCQGPVVERVHGKWLAHGRGPVRYIVAEHSHELWARTWYWDMYKAQARERGRARAARN